MDVLRGQHRQSAVPVLGVVPAEEVHAEAAGVLEAAEAIRELGPVLQRLELRPPNGWSDPAGRRPATGSR